MIKDKKVKVNKQKPSNACPARLMLIAIKCPLIQRQAAPAAIPMLCVCAFPITDECLGEINISAIDIGHIWMHNRNPVSPLIKLAIPEVKPFNS